MVSSSTIAHYSERLRPLLSLQGLLLLLIVILFSLGFRETFAELLHYWVEGYNWQFLIPIALIYMLWERRDIFYQLQYKPAILTGLVLLLGSSLLLIAGQLSSTHALRELAIIGTVFSLSVMLLGIGATRRLFWPLAYLVLMTSLPTDLLDALRAPLKLISATISTDVLQFLGYAIYREGTFLYLPHITLEVADECSGVNQLTSSIALGIPIAFTILNSWWKRIFIILVSVFFGIAMNWLRVILISLWHYDSAKETIHGPQDIYGLPFIFMVGVFLTLVIAFAMAEKGPSEGTAGGYKEKPSPFSAMFGARRFTESALAANVILGLSAVYLLTWTALPVEPLEPLDEFPMSIAGYEGQRVEKLERPFYSGLADDELIASYRSPGNETATVYIGHFRMQDQERELVDYRYNWLHEDAESQTIETELGATLVKRRTIENRSSVRQVFFTYDINGRNLIDLKRAKLASLIDAFLKQRNDGAIIMVIFDSKEEVLSAERQRFLTAVVDKAREMLPD